MPATGTRINRQIFIRIIDGLILFCFCVLVLFLPIANTESVRAFALGIPGGLWVIQMIVTRRFRLKRTAADLPLALFTLVAGLSVVTAVSRWYSLDEFIGEWVIGIFLFYLVVNHVNPGDLKYLLGALLLGNILMVSYGCFDFFRDGGKLWDYHVRASSLHYGFGAFSTYLVTVLPYIFMAFYFVRSRRPRLFLAILMGVNLVCLYLTHARGAWIAAAVLVLITAWNSFSKKVFLILIGSSGLALFFAAPPGVVWHMAPLSAPGSASNAIETGDARWEVIKFSLGKIQENPFRMIGFGQRSFVKKYPEFYEKYKGALLWQAHNTFLNMALQTGIQGLVLFLWLLYRILRYCREKSRSTEFPLLQFYFRATFIMVFIFFIRNLTDDFFKDDTALLFWFLSGVALGIKTEGAARQKRMPERADAVPEKDGIGS